MNNFVPLDPTDPTFFTPDQRDDEIAAILAIGMQRLLSTRASHPVSLLDNSAPNGLDAAPPLSLHGDNPVNATGEPERI